MVTPRIGSGDLAMHDRDAVLSANEAFYAAFARADADAMDEVWAREAESTCLHPGWSPLVGREAVLESWRAILSGDKAPEVNFSDPSAHVMGDSAYVLCRELAGGVWLAATNVFVREGGAWRMIHHHSGPAPRPARAAARGPETLQ